MQFVSLQNQVLTQELNANQNPEGYKLCIKQLLKGIQDRAYWYFTAEQAQFLTNVYKKQVSQQVVRDRLAQITDDILGDVLQQIKNGNLKKVNDPHADLVTQVIILQKVQQIAMQGSDYYAPNHPKARQTRDKIQAINQDYKQFKDRIDKIKQKQRQKQIQKESIQRQIKKKIQDEKRQQYHEQVKHRIQIMKRKQQQRNQQNQKFKTFLKQFKKSKPLHELMEEEYKERIQLPMIEESRMKLQMRRHKKKPTLQQINNHQLAYLTSKQSRPQKTLIQHHSIDVAYKSQFYKQEQERSKQGADDSYTSTLWDQLQKKKRYSLFVKDNHKPMTSRVLHNAVQESKTQANLRKQSPDLSRIKQVGKFYLQYVRNLEKNRTISQDKEEEEQSRIGTQSRYTNYLEDLKRSHQGQQRGFGVNWQRDINDRTASKSQKRDRVLIKTKQLEQQASRQEQFVKNFNYGKPEDIIEKKRHIDGMLLQSIKAKMALLKDSETQ